jgi:hypothetical protein
MTQILRLLIPKYFFLLLLYDTGIRFHIGTKYHTSQAGNTVKAKITKSNYFFLKLFKKHLLISKYILYIQAKRKKYQLPRTKMAVGESNQTTKKQHVL